MARMPRVVVPGYPHHGTQRGYRRQERNPAATRLCKSPEDWKSYLSEGVCDDDKELIGIHGRTGRPLGCSSFVQELEAVTGKILTPRQPVPKKKSWGWVYCHWN